MPRKKKSAVDRTANKIFPWTIAKLINAPLSVLKAFRPRRAIQLLKLQGFQWQNHFVGLHSVQNQLIDRKTGHPVRLRGVNLQDPLWQRLAPGPRLFPHGTFNLEQARIFGANAVRVPFHPATIRHIGGGDWEKGLTAVSNELDWILLAAHALRLWVIVDFHAIGLPAEEMFFEFDEEPFENIYETNQYEIESFWRHVSNHAMIRLSDPASGYESLAAFELFNEATRDSAFGTADDWNIHATWAEALLNEVIRPKNLETLAIVGGLHFGYDLEFALSRPVRDGNIAYASHPYPHHSQAKHWGRAFGDLAERHPVLLTEIGFSAEGFFGRHQHRGFRDWELEIQSYADKLGLSFFAWNFSAHWEPTLFEAPPVDAVGRTDDETLELKPNEAGLFFQTWMRTLGQKESTAESTFESPTESATTFSWPISSSP